MSSEHSVEPYDVFDVDSSGRILQADFNDDLTRADCYNLSLSWINSPEALSREMESLYPLACAVHAIYSDARDEIKATLDEVSDSSESEADMSELRMRLEKMPEEPEEGAEEWLMALSQAEFDSIVMPAIKDWLDDLPDFNYEEDYLPETSTAQGLAAKYFEGLSDEDFQALGVEFVSPSTRYGGDIWAELKVDIETANEAAAKAGIPVRFRRAID